MTIKTILHPKLIEPNQRWDTLYGCSQPLALAEYCKHTPGIKLLITPDNFSAGQLFDEIRFFLGKNLDQQVLHFPDWETLPYDQFSPHQDIVSERLRVLNHIQQTNKAVVVAAVSTLMHRLPPPSFLMQFGLSLHTGQSLNIDNFRHQLLQSGYHHVNKVLEHGEFALRGSLIDLYPMGSELPFRLDLFDNDIETLRRFDPETQLTVEKISSIDILPAHEFPMDEASISQFRQNFRESFTANVNQCPIYEAISNGQAPGGIEYYLPLFFANTVSLFDYLPESSAISLINAVLPAAEQFWHELSQRFEQRRYDVTRPILPPERCFFSPTQLFTLTNQFNPLRCVNTPGEKRGKIHHFNTQEAPALPIARNANEPLEILRQYLNQQTFQRYLIVAESAGRREVLLDLLKQSQITPSIQASWEAFLESTAPINITVGELAAGTVLLDPSISIIVEAQLFGHQRTPQRRITQKHVDPDLIIRDLAELQLGDPVVHLSYGVGRYQGLQCIESSGISNEFLILAYAGSDKIYVPITSLQLISRYTGSDPDNAPLHRLGSDNWQKEKKKAAEKIHDVAIELLDVYAKREANVGYSYQSDPLEYQRFSNGFPFEETIDQQHAIEQLLNDMKSNRPMDRLICGDVGFGKTEVAMRAAYVAAQNGKQVCVLVPTTLLAGQHFETFCDRFADFPIRVDLLSRFRSAKESQQVLEATADGRVDILIGTHKLLQKTLQFKQLGLLIIDEEHRFGVKQKETIKALKSHVDILSMTATPIPRTLNMAMAGIRDISLIATPPAKRLAIKTFWQVRNDNVIREAILREILRGGQVFFLHNNVQTIERIVQDLQTLVPEAKISHAHGQMRERDLEQVMSDFYHHRFNVLVSTTIIETGIDIPTANTIIIDQAQNFGLAQIHQLRGRVGRSHHQAYAYLLTPDEKLITKDAVKRLEAIVSLEDLGAGFTLATHDLEIRGAGELLGEEQSGNMHAIGFNLFMEMLDKAVSDLKSGKTPELTAPMQTGPEIELGISAIIPEAYISDIHARLIMYKKISNAKTQEQLRQIKIELIDRFGLLPPSVNHLVLITELKWLASALGIKRLSATGPQGKVEFEENPKINAEAFIKLIQLHPKRYQMDGPTRMRFVLEMTKTEERIVEIKALLNELR